MTLALDVALRRGAFSLEVAIESAGRVTALFGPSGSGKSSLIELIAGLARPDRGRIAVDRETLVDTATGTFLPPHRRRVGVVFQDARLFPHLSVRGNLLFGARLRRPSAASLDGVVALLGIDHLLDRRTPSLSGGEAQRVAIGRALLSSPRLLLMDEPLASLDEARKAEIAPYLKRLAEETRVPIVYVSHSLAEVAQLATDIVVLEQGRVRAAGPAAAVLPRLDLLPAGERGEGGALLAATVLAHEDAWDMTVLASPAGELRVPRLAAAAGTAVRLRIRARDVIVATERPVGLSALNILAGTVAAIGPAGDGQADIAIDCAGERLVARITGRSARDLGLAPGRAVYAIIKSVALDAGPVASPP